MLHFNLKKKKLKEEFIFYINLFWFILRIFRSLLLRDLLYHYKLFVVKIGGSVTSAIFKHGGPRSSAG